MSRSRSSSESEIDMNDSDTDWDFSSDDESSDAGTDGESTPPDWDPLNQNGSDVGPWKEKGYNDTDDGPPGMEIPVFRPERTPGLQLAELLRTREDIKKFLTPLSFFKLFFTVDLLQMVCGYTNTYAELIKKQKPSVYEGWTGIEPEDLYCFIGLLMYMSIVKIPEVEYYWSNEPLFSGLWARSFMSELRYKQIQTFLKCSDPSRGNDNKIPEVRLLHDTLRRSCLKYWQPNEQIYIEKLMVQRKDSLRGDTSSKYETNILMLTDSVSGYTYNFDVCVGKGQKMSSGFGLGHDTVVNLCSNLFKQGYKLFVDGFYASVQLFRSLLALGISACGTVLQSRKDFPQQFRNTEEFHKNAERGLIRWVRLKEVGCVQWKINKVVTYLTTMHKNINHRSRTFYPWRTRVNGKFRSLSVSQPSVAVDYNKFMGNVDRSDLFIGDYDMLRRTSKSWKSLFYHLIDIARVNSFVMFQEFCKKHPLPELQRPAAYNELDFTSELIEELGNIKGDTEVPIYTEKPVNGKCNALVPEWTRIRRNCVRCYRNEKVERKSRALCASCQKYFCFHSGRNCLLAEHDEK